MQILKGEHKDAKVTEHKTSDGLVIERADGSRFTIYEAEARIPQKTNITTLESLRHVSLREAATTSEFPNQLRSDFNVILLSAFNSVADNMLPLYYKVNSTKEVETYAGIHKMKQTPGVKREDSPYFMLGTSPKDNVTITNYVRGGIVEITEDMIRYDKSGEIARLATELGDSIRYERYQLLTEVLANTANTTASASTLTLTASNLETMVTAYMKQQDSTSKKVLAWAPDTIVVPATLQWTARRILESPGIPGSANNDINVMKGIVNLVVNPLLDVSTTTGYSTSLFYLGRANNANGLVYQNVIGPEPETFVQDSRQSQLSDDCFIYDLVRYKARLCYGQDVIDTRIWHRSTT